MDLKIQQKMKAHKGLPQQDLDQESCLKLGQLINSMTQSIQFTLVKPSLITMCMIIKIWSSRRLFGEDKKLLLTIENPKIDKEQIIQVVKDLPSITMIIDGDKFQSKGIIKSENFMYYEGVKENMFIYWQQTGSRYYGQVKSLENIEPHGQGRKFDNAGTKEQISYVGQFVNGKKQGRGHQVRKNIQYEGFWQDNQKHGWGTQLVRRKKKLADKTDKSSKSQKTQSEKDHKQQQLQQGQQLIREKQDLLQEQGQKGEQNSLKKSQISNQKATLTDKQVKQKLRSYRSIYIGPFQKGFKCGQDGTEYTRHGTYVGEWSNNMKNGKGKIKYKEGAQYQGQWKNNFLQGQGIYIDEAKNRYEGNFLNGLYDGQGKMKYANGDQYQGSWSQGKKHGKGVYTYADGDYYDGQWVKDSAEGTGSSMIQGVLYQGSFVKGMKEGMGQLTTQDGDQIKGIWKKNQRIQTISINGQITNENQQEQKVE